MIIATSFRVLEYFAHNCVSEFFNISINHHDPLFDDLACAKIMIKTIKRGYLY
jgi:hypothetical protein